MTEAQQQDRPILPSFCGNVPGLQAPHSLAFYNAERGKQRNSWEHCQGQQKRNQHHKTSPNPACMQLLYASCASLCFLLVRHNKSQVFGARNNCTTPLLTTPPLTTTMLTLSALNFSCELEEQDEVSLQQMRQNWCSQRRSKLHRYCCELSQAIPNSYTRCHVGTDSCSCPALLAAQGLGTEPCRAETLVAALAAQE